MTRLLLVDDEPHLLEGLQRALRAPGEWEIVCATSGPAALAELDHGPVDVILSDYAMPGMDGATLLGHIRDRQPDAVRIILSGRSDRDAGIRALAVAHQFLRKPCEPDQLREVITRACAVRTWLDLPALRELVGELGALPSSPARYGELSALLADPDVSIQAIANIVERDVAMTARCLQIVNSAFFGLRRRITVVREAIVYLGLDTLRTVVFSTSAFRTISPSGRLPGFDLGDFEAHAAATAAITGGILRGTDASTDGRMAGMLHDVGKLVLASRMPQEFAEALRASKRRSMPLHEAEFELFGVSHAEIGAYLLGVWGLPLTIVEAVAHHHNPRRSSGASPVLPALHVGNVLAYERDRITSSRSSIDIPYLESRGLLDELPAWRSQLRSNNN